MRYYSLVSFISYGALVTAASSAANAQNVAAVAEKAADNAMETIVVTARRREETLQTVPIAITALTAADLKRRNIIEPRDIADSTPSLNITSGLGRSGLQFSMRGQAAQAIGGRTAVQNYFADLPPNMTSLADFFDLDSVQVLRGPQGTLFGRAANAGAVVITPKAPGWAFEGFATAQLGNLNDREFVAGVTIPIIPEKLSIRASANIVRRDGFTHVLNLNNLDLDDKNYNSARFQVRWKPSDDIENITVFNYHEIDQNTDSYFMQAARPGGTASSLYSPQFPLFPSWLLQNPRLAALPGVSQGLQYYFNNILPQLGPRQQYLNVNADNLRQKSYLYLLSNKTTISFGDVSIRNIFGFQDSKLAIAEDNDGTPFPILNLVDTTINGSPPEVAGRTRSFSDELHLFGTTNLGSMSLEWLLGGFWQKNDGRNTPQAVGLVSAFAIVNSRSFWTPFVPSSRTKALFTQETFHITPKLSFTGGMRYSWDNAKNIGYRGQINIGSDGNSIPPLTCIGTTIPFDMKNPACKGTDTSSNSHGMNWLLSLDYKISEQMLVYIASRHGYNAGGINGFANVAGLGTYAAERVTDLELGLKSQGRLGSVPFRFNLDGYVEWLTNAQRLISLVDPFTRLPSAITVNARSAKVTGMEAELTITPFSWLNLNAYGSYTDAKYNRFTIPQLTPNPATPGGVDIVYFDASGYTFAKTPRYQYGFLGTFTLPIKNNMGTLSLSANYSWRSSARFTDDSRSDPLAVLPSYGLLNLRLDWNNVADAGFDAGVFVRNATKTVYLLGGNSSPSTLGYNWTNYGEPRTIGAQLTYRFGAAAGR